jgi:hypothetical protein
LRWRRPRGAVYCRILIEGPVAKVSGLLACAVDFRPLQNALAVLFPFD